jgi:hypothetical protein
MAAFADNEVTGLQPSPYQPDWPYLLRDIGKSVLKVATCSKVETYLLRAFLPYWRQLSPETWHEVLLRARETAQANAQNLA